MAWVLRVLAAVFLALGQAWAAEPALAEPPPEDFTARQYIDSTGCVFLRDDAGQWSPRVARDGSQLCGYPPSLSARGRAADPRLADAARRGRADQVEQVLNQLVITNLAPGELASDTRPREALTDHGPEPAPQGPLDELKAEISASAEVRQQMAAGIKPNLRLCELLGYDGKRIPTTQGDLGRDPTQGYCGSLPQADLARLAFARPAGGAAPKPPQMVTDAAPVAPVVAARPEPRAVRPAAPIRLAAAGARAPAPSVSASPSPLRPPSPPRVVARPTAPPVPDIASHIPPGARFVHVGSYSVQANAEATGRRVAQMGLPVSRAVQIRPGRDMLVVIAGPFDGREAVVRALDQIRKAGFSDAYAR